MSVIDYQNRTIDVLAFQGGQPGQNVEMDQVLVPDDLGGYAVTGIEKLVQRFLIMLLTEKGTIRYLPEAGTRFMIDARRGNWRITTDVTQSFASAMVDIGRQMAALETASDPADERFASAELLTVTLTGDSVMISVRLHSAAGTSRVFIAPVAVVIKEGGS